MCTFYSITVRRTPILTPMDLIDDSHLYTVSAPHSLNLYDDSPVCTGSTWASVNIHGHPYKTPTHFVSGWLVSIGIVVVRIITVYTSPPH